MLGTVVLNHNSDVEQVEEERKKNISNLDHLYGSFRFQSIAIAPLIVGIILAGILLLLCTRVIQCCVCVCVPCVQRTLIETIETHGMTISIYVPVR